MRSVDRTLRLKEDDLVSDINSVEVFVLSIEVEVYPHGVLDCIDDGGVAFAGEHPTGNFVLCGRKSFLFLQSVKPKGSVSLFRFSLFPDFDSLGGDDLLIRRGRGRERWSLRGEGWREGERRGWYLARGIGGRGRE